MEQLGMETAETDNVITLTINRGLTESENDLLMKRVEDLRRQLSIRIIVIPFSTDAVNVESTDAVNVESTDAVNVESTDVVNVESTDAVNVESTDAVNVESTDMVDGEK